MNSEALSTFPGVVNNAFKYGITEIEVIQFKSTVTDSQTLNHTLKETIAVGRGGTDFLSPIDCATERDLDGLVILTEGYAPEPDIPAHFKTPILWVLESNEAYREREA